MVKRYSDQNRTLIRRSGIPNANLGRIDATPANTFFNAATRLADTATKIYTDQAKIQAEEDGIRDGRTKGVTIDAKGNPVYNPPDVGGVYYQRAYEKSAETNYKLSLQDSIANKIDQGYKNWLDDPSNIDNMEMLQSNISGAVSGLLDAVPDEYKAFANNQASNRIASYMKTEYSQLNSRKHASLVKDNLANIKNIIADRASTPSSDTDTIALLDDNFKEALESLAPLVHNSKNTLLAFGKEYGFAGSIQDTVDIIFARNEQNKLLNFDKLDQVRDVLNTRTGSVTIKSSTGQDIVINSEYIKNNIGDQPTANKIIERINKASNNLTSKSNVYNSAKTDLVSTANNISTSFDTGVIYKQYRIEDMDEVMVNMTNTLEEAFDTIVKENNIANDSQSFIKLNADKERLLTDLNTKFLRFQSTVEKSYRKRFIENSIDDIANDIFDEKIPFPDLIDKIENTLDYDQLNPDLLNLKTLNEEEVNVIRDIIKTDDSDSPEYLSAIRTAIKAGGTDDKVFTIGDKDFSARDLNTIFNTNSLLKSKAIDILNNQISGQISSGTGSNKQNRVQAVIDAVNQNNFIYESSITNKDKNDAFELVLREKGNIDINNLNQELQDVDKLESISLFINQTTRSTGFLPDLIKNYFDTMKVDLANKDINAISTKVNLFSRLYTNPVNRSQLAKYPMLSALNRITNNGVGIQGYMTYLNSFTEAEDKDVIIEQGLLSAGIEGTTKEARIANMIKKAGDLFPDRKIQTATFINKNFNTLALELGLLALMSESQPQGYREINLEDRFEQILESNIENLIPLNETVYEAHKEKNAVYNGTKDPIVVSDQPFEDLSKIDNYAEKNGVPGGNVITHMIVQNELAKYSNLELDMADDMPIEVFKKPPVDEEFTDQNELATIIGGTTANVEINIPPSINTENIATVRSAEELYTINLDNGSSMFFAPNVSYTITDDGKIRIKGRITNKVDANAGSYVFLGNLKNEGQDIVIEDLESKVNQVKQVIKEDRLDTARKTAELNKNRPTLNVGDIITSTITQTPLPEGKATSTAKPPTNYKNLTKLKVGSNTLKNNTEVNLTKEEIKYINLSREVLVHNKVIKNNRNENVTVAGRIVTESSPDAPTPIFAKQFHYVIPSVIAQEVNGEIQYRQVKPGESKLLFQYIDSRGGIDTFPRYNSLEEARNAEIKMKKVINEDDKVMSGKYIANEAFTMPKTRGKSTASQAVNVVLNWTAGNNDANRRFLMATLGTESDYGIDKRTYRPNRISTGMAQFDKIRYDENGEEIIAMFDDLKRRHKKELKASSYGKAGQLHPLFGKTVKKIEDGFNSEYPNLLGKEFKFENLTYDDLNIPLVAVSVMRLWLTTQGATSTYDTAEEAYWLYKNKYNTKLAIDTEDKFIDYWNKVND